ncbi:MAG: hypothetical protein CL512_04895 [Actinobacteria bacterium]|nr:hypothetical protein [Actinomycetota bacterium]
MIRIKIEGEEMIATLKKEEVKEDHISFRLTDALTQETLPYFFTARKRGKKEIFIFVEGKQTDLSEILYVDKVAHLIEALPSIVTEALDLIEKEK